MNKPLLPLSAFLAAQPGVTWFQSTEPAAYVARGTHVRWRIQRELSNIEPGVDYVRREALAEQGVSASEEDSREFAQNLAAALADHLTPRNLRHLAEVFAAEYQKTQANRAAFRAALEEQTKAA